MSTLVEQTKARKDYHAKWDAIAKEEVQRVKDEDALDKQASSLSLGTDSGPKSEAEAQDKATNKALREAKALWEKRRDEEKKQKLIIKGETKTVVVDPKLLGDALVVDIQQCKKAVVTLIPGLKVAKVFVSQCEDVVVEVRCPLITSFVEVSRCTKTTLITSKVLHTVQCDLCDDCSIIWATIECFNEAQDPGSRVYSAACRRLGVAVGGRQNSMRVEVDNFDRSLIDENIPIKEQQFVTQLVDGKLLTERIVQGTSKRLVGTTLRELEREGASATTVAEEQAADAEREKLAGNQAFQKREYGQAAVHYTVALERPAFASGRPRAVVLANRSACFLKLGDHGRALEDAAAAAGVDDTYAKAHFRRGLALHALGRYREALPELGKARDLEPKNAQVADAIRFAEMRLSRGA